MKHRYVYLRDYSKENKHPIGCVAFYVKDDSKEIYYAFSACSPKDVFNSKVARHKASGRLTQRPHVLKLARVPDSFNDIVKHIMEHISSQNNDQAQGGSRSLLAFNAATGWLKNQNSNAPAAETVSA